VLDPASLELVLIQSNVANVAGTQTITPLAMINRSVGGAAYGLQPGVNGGAGLNNIGLLLEIVGQVTYVSPGAPYYFVIDDGSQVYDPVGRQGIGCRCGSITPPSLNSYRTVRGICTNEGGVPVLVLRSSSDWN